MTGPFRPLTPNEVARLIESAAAAIRAELAAHPDDVLAWHPAPGEWCAKEVVGHLIEAERRGFAGRIRLMLAGDEPLLDAWDQTEVARAPRLRASGAGADRRARRAPSRQRGSGRRAPLGGSHPRGPASQGRPITSG